MAFLDELAAHGDRVSVRPQDETGLLDLATLLGTPQPDTLVYCCGPEPLLAAVEQRCAGWPSRALHVERFTARPMSAPVRAEAFDVELARSGLTLTVPPDRSILDVVEAAGVGVLSSCAEGTCGTCETGVLDGLPDHRDSVLTPEERAVERLHADLRLPVPYRAPRARPLTRQVGRARSRVRTWSARPGLCCALQTIAYAGGGATASRRLASCATRSSRLR